MRVIALQLTANAKPLLNNTFINTELKQHQEFEMHLNNNMIEIIHREKGAFIIPLTSVSWFRPDPIAAGYTFGQAAPSVKKRRGRPRKSTPIVTKVDTLAKAEG